MKYEPFSKVVQRFSIRKYSIGVASVFLGSSIFAGSVVQAEEQTQPDSMEINPVSTEVEKVEEAVSTEPQLLYAAEASVEPTQAPSTLATNHISVDVQPEQPVTVSERESVGDFEKGSPLRASTTGAVSSSLQTPIDFGVDGFTESSTDPQKIIVLSGGTYFDNISENGNQIFLRQTDWNKFKGSGFSTEYGKKGHSGEYLIWFENPTFYNNIDTIKIKTDSIYNESLDLTPYHNKQLWTIPVDNRFVSFADDPNSSQDATNIPLTITLKSGQTVSGLLGDQAITFGSAFVSGGTYGSVAQTNRLVLDTLNGAWFSTSMPNREAVFTSTAVDSIFTDTKNRKTEDSSSNAEISELFPIVNLDGQVTGLKFITRYELVEGRSILTEPRGTIPYIVQKIPQDLMRLVDPSKVQLYASNAAGAPLAKGIPLVVDNSGLLHTKATPAISMVGVTTNEEAEVKRQTLSSVFRPIIEKVTTPSVILSGYYEPAAYTIEYGFKNPVSKAELSELVHQIAKSTGVSAIAETWKERGAYLGSGQTEGVMRNTYSNTYLDRSVLAVETKLVGNLTQAETYQPSYPTYEVQRGKTTIVPQTAAIPRGTTFTTQSLNSPLLSFGERGAAILTIPEDNRLGDRNFTVTVRYPDGSTESLDLKVVIVEAQTEEADKYSPSYAPATVEAGQTVVLPGQGLPSQATYRVSGEGMTIDGQGRVTVEVPASTSAGTLRGEVLVVYSDGSEDRVPVSIQVTAKPVVTPEADKYSPSYAPVTVEAGQTVVLPGQGLPSQATYRVSGEGMTIDGQGRVTVEVPASASAGTLRGEVLVVYSDGTEDRVPVSVQVTAKPVVTPEADKYSPSYAPATVEAGQTVVLSGQGLPSQATYRVNGEGMTIDGQGRVTVEVPVSASAGTLRGEVLVVYSDGTEDRVPVSIQVTVKPVVTPEADKYSPSYAPATVEAGQTVVLSGQGLPSQATYRVSGEGMTIDGQGRVTVEVPASASAGALRGEVLVVYSDGTEDRIPVSIQVTAKPVVTPEADKYNPSYAPATVEAGQTVVLSGQDLPSQATYRVSGEGMAIDGQGRVTVEVPASASAGTLRGEVLVVYSDGTEDRVPVSIQVTAKPVVTPEADKYSPSYAPVTVEAGQTVVLPGQGLPSQATYRVRGEGMTIDGQGRVTVEVPSSASAGTLTGEVLVVYSDGTEDRVPVSIQVTAKPVVTPEADKYSPSYALATVEAGQTVVLPGQGLPSQATYRVRGEGMTIDGQGRVTVEVPSSASAGTLTGEVLVVYSDGTEDRVPVSIQVTAKPVVTPEADKYSPSYALATVEAGQTVVMSGQGLPSQATYRVSGEGMAIDGQGRVTVEVPASASAGTLTGEVLVVYSDGTEDRVPVSIQVTAKPVVTPEADKYSPSYAPATVEAGQTVVMSGQGLPSQAIYRVSGEGMTIDGQGRVTVEVPASASAGTLRGEVLVVYSDGSEDRVPVSIQVTAKPVVTPEADKYSPSYAPATVEAGQTVVLSGQGLPSQATYRVSGEGMAIDGQGRVTVEVPSSASAGTLTGEVLVVYSDGTEDRVPVSIQVTAKPVVTPEADKYSPSYALATVEAGQTVVLPGQGLPSQATYRVRGEGMTIDGQGRVTVEVPSSASAGTLRGEVLVVYSDGSEDRIPVSIQVTAKPVVIPEADKYSPSYVPVEVEPGTQVRIPALNLPSSATYSIVGEGMTVDTQGWVIIRVPVGTKSGLLTGQVTVRYSDGSEDLVPVRITVKAVEQPVTPVDPEQPVKPVAPEQPVIPVDPEQPVKPVAPEQPVTPVDPEQPVKPVAPEEPVKPVDPEEPVTPVDPEQPVKPVAPEQPVTPVEPEQPVKPVAPEQPVKPVAPEQPVIPVDPEQPVKPVAPEQPVTPVDPEQPVKPVAPEEPVKPVDPEEPVTPVAPEQPVKPVNPEEPVKPVDPEEPVTPVDPEEPVKPVAPEQPVKPVAPEQPVKPVAPEQPVTPVEPEEPVKPVDPEQPVKPVEPEQPVKPVDPEQPVKPVDPEEPVKPVAPEESVKPVAPEQPVTPVDPEEPVKPVDPEQPVKPVDPEQPVKPMDPEQPVIPVDPDQPVTPVVPEIPEQDNRGEKVENLGNPGSGNVVQELGEAKLSASIHEQSREQQLPNTGESRNRFAHFLAWLLSLIGFGFLFGKNKKEEK
ncbi:Rib/alpha-like domain-containing protein [Streptococcus sp. 10F2]